MKIELPQTGGCFCGALRYSLEEQPLTLYACHCTDCQRQSGTSFVLSMFVPAQALRLTRGEVASYVLETPDGRTKRGKFCRVCSTRLWGEPPKLPGFAVLRPGTLDDTSWVRPVAHIWTASAQPWVRIPGGDLQFAGQPDEAGVRELVRTWKQHLAG